jgi:hypothetical protein
MFRLHQSPQVAVVGLDTKGKVNKVLNHSINLAAKVLSVQITATNLLKELTNLLQGTIKINRKREIFKIILATNILMI